MRHFSKPAALLTILCGALLLTCTACGKKETGELSCFRNLAAEKGVTISADGELSEGQSAGAAADGREDTAWVMNLPEDAVPETAAEHVLTVTWKKEKAVSFVRTVWGDLNCFGYRIEGSADGGTYETLYESKEAPYLREDLAKIGPGMYRSIRLIVRGCNFIFEGQQVDIARDIERSKEQIQARPTIATEQEVVNVLEEFRLYVLQQLRIVKDILWQLCLGNVIQKGLKVVECSLKGLQSIAKLKYLELFAF